MTVIENLYFNFFSQKVILYWYLKVTMYWCLFLKQTSNDLRVKIYSISEIWVLIKTHSQKLGYISELVTLVSKIVMFFGFANIKISNIGNLLYPSFFFFLKGGGWRGTFTHYLLKSRLQPSSAIILFAK